MLLYQTVFAIVAGLVAGPAARADEVIVDVAFADGFDPMPATVFRIGSVALRDPHVFYSIVFCVDVTDQVNQQIQQQLDADQDGDGFYDTSALAVMKPYDDSGSAHGFESRDGVCTVALPTQCAPGIEPPVTRWYEPFDLSPPTICLGALPGTTSGYDPPVPAPGGHCFATSVIDAALPFGTSTIPLWDTEFGGPWPAASGSTAGGLMRGFLRESDADQITIDFNGQSVTLSSLLPDGSGSCATGVADGKDIDRGEPGWWMYLEDRLDAVSATGF
jgi:hypothetical protein